MITYDHSQDEDNELLLELATGRSGLLSISYTRRLGGTLILNQKSWVAQLEDGVYNERDNGFERASSQDHRGRCTARTHSSRIYTLLDA